MAECNYGGINRSEVAECLRHSSFGGWLELLKNTRIKKFNLLSLTNHFYLV